MLIIKYNSHVRQLEFLTVMSVREKNTTRQLGIIPMIVIKYNSHAS